MKYYGEVGYAETEETSPGVWEEKIIPKFYYGDVLQMSKRYEPREQVIDDINITNQISIVADPYAYEHFAFIRYVKWAGVRWIVKSVDVQYPRLILNLGGVYNGEPS